MKKILLKTMAVLFVFVFTGCNDWLNVSPKTEMKAEDLFKNEAGFRDALIGVYSLMVRSDSYGQDLTYGWLDVLAQYYASPLQYLSTGSHSFREAADYDYEAAGEQNRVLNIWSNQYTAIANINLALQFIDVNRDVFKTEALHHIYKGELLGLRAMLHFDILRLFASSASMDNGKGLESLAIPYLEIYTNLAQPQLTGAEVIAKVKRDLNEAKELMRDYEDFSVSDEYDPMYARGYKMNYYAVVALLARVHLYVGEKSEALACVKEVIGEANGEIPNLFRLTTSSASPTNPMFTSELIFMLDVQQLKDLSDPYFLSNIVGAEAYNLTISYRGYENMFSTEGTESDFRATWTDKYKDGISYVLKKYENMTYVPLFKISELFLIAAESAGGAEGEAYLNKLRNHRGLAVMSDHTSFDDYLLQEYRREFIGEGQMFFFYKRHAMDRIGAEENIGIDDLNAVYNIPIPQSEIEFGKIKQ